MSTFEYDARLVEKLAKAAHEIFCKNLVENGYRFGRVTSVSEKTHSSLIPFDKLPDDEKEQNRGTVRDILEKLAVIGCRLQPGRGRLTPLKLRKDQVEQLSKREHQRWMNQKMEDGWQYGETTDKVTKRHKDMVPWDVLSEEDKEKDRVMVRAIPKMLSAAGYAIVKMDKSS